MLILRWTARGLLLLAVAVVFSKSAGAGVAPAYSVVGLGSLGQSNYAYHINDTGDIVGAYYTSNDPEDFHSFWYHSGQMIDLFPGERSSAQGVNSAGTIAGFDTATDSRAWTYSNGVRTIIPTVQGAVTHGITDAGIVVGYSLFGNSVHPFTYDGHVIHDLALPTGSSLAQAYGINKQQEVVGIASLVGGPNVPVLYSGGKWSFLAEDYPLGGLAYAINDAGAITGEVSTSNSQTRAFRISNGVLSLLGNGDGSSFGYGINQAGIIVGENNTSAFIDDGVSMVNLNTLLEPGTGWYLYAANDINDNGEIVGWGFDPLGNQRGFLLEPLVPEPHGFLFVTLTILALASRHFRRRESCIG